MPASKSISARALITYALARPDGLSRQALHTAIANLSDCDDTEAMMAALSDMPEVIDIGAAGTAMRFLTAYLCVTPGTHVITGTERMKHRPIGILVGQWAKAFGAKEVYYFDVDDRKIDFCKSLGFKQYEKDVHIHCVLEGTGFADALSKCLEAIAPGGRMVLMGNPSKEVCLSQNTYWHILRKELTVYGTWNSSYNPKQNDWVESLKAMAEGKINVKPLITHVFPLEKCNEAFEMMKDRREFFNKVMLDMGGDADDK